MNSCNVSVDLKPEWKKGQNEADRILLKYFGKKVVNFDGLFFEPDHDLLRPIHKYVGIKSIPDNA